MSGSSSPPALLVLEDGSVFRGRSVGAQEERCFELVFQTAMTGYQEILTDPSYRGQGVLMTYPQIGNTGTTAEDDESHRCWAEALVVHEMSPLASNWRSEMPLPEYLRRHGVPAIEGVDTRAITLKLRERGTMRAILSCQDREPEALLRKVRAHPPLDGRDLVSEVTRERTEIWEEGLPEAFPSPGLELPPENPLPLVCVDLGIKRNILRSLVNSGFSPLVVPARTSAEEILEHSPAALFLSNGPGDPSALPGVHRTVRRLARSGLPILGICLGHQVLAHAFGGRTSRMKFGHHGANHPVIELATGRIDITSQNHNFAVDPTSLSGTGLVVTHRNGNDDSVEGLAHQDLPIFSVQYHPEAAPGPHDAAHLFHRFRSLTRDAG